MEDILVARDTYVWAFESSLQKIIILIQFLKILPNNMDFFVHKHTFFKYFSLDTFIENAWILTQKCFLKWYLVTMGKSE